MTADLFEKWLKEQLLPNLQPNSVIVMDNASYHSRILNKIPNTSTKKDDILNFMRDKGITIPKKIPVKSELLKIIKTYNFKNEYIIDELCKTHGHILLRLPPYYCIFNPIELIWALLKKRLRQLNRSPTSSGEVLDLIRNVISAITNDEWKNCVTHAIKNEDQYTILPPVAPLIIQPGFDSSSDSDTDSYESS